MVIDVKNKRKFKKGSIFVEVIITLGITSIIALAILQAAISWQRSWNINRLQMDVQFEARRSMSRIAGELMQTSSSTVTVNAANDVITFQLPNNDYAAGGFTWGDQIQYSLVAGPAGGQLLRTNLDTAATEVLANNVNTVWFDLNNDVISIQLTVNKTFKDDTSQVQLNSQVSLRNL